MSCRVTGCLMSCSNIKITFPRLKLKHTSRRECVVHLMSWPAAFVECFPIFDVCSAQSCTFYTKKIKTTPFHMTLAVAEALNPNKPKPFHINRSCIIYGFLTRVLPPARNRKHILQNGCQAQQLADRQQEILTGINEK